MCSSDLGGGGTTLTHWFLFALMKQSSFGCSHEYQMLVQWPPPFISEPCPRSPLPLAQGHVCLSLYKAEFQGLWPLRTKEEMKEVCSAFNISKEHCTKYVQFGNTFNLLHATASYISIHQNSVGVAGVSDKYGKRSWARYPALWTLKHVDSLPNPDPTDIEALDAKPVSTKNVAIDQEAEAKRPELKRQAQEWAGIAQDPRSDLFVFVGRWSKQKGVDLIADIMPSM